MGNCFKVTKRVKTTPYQLRFDPQLSSEFETPNLLQLTSGRYQKFTSSNCLPPALTFTSATPISQLAEIDREYLTSINVVKSGLLDIPQLSLGEYLIRNIEQHEGNHEAFVIYGQRGLTYEELISQTVTTSWIVRSLNCTKVLLICSNCVQFAALSIALLLLKIPAAIINPKATDLYDVKDLLSINPTVIFCTKDVAKDCQVLANKIKSVRDVVLVDCEDSVCEGQKTLSQFLKFPIPLEATPSTDCIDKPNDFLTETAFIVWTSGRRNDPKMVSLSHYNIVSSLISLSQGPIGPDDNCLGLIPVFHPFGLILALFNCLATGCPITFLPKIEPTALLNCIQQRKISLCIGVPPVLYFLLENHPGHNIGSLTDFINTAAPLSVESVAKAGEQLPKMRIYNTYGLCETASITHFGLVKSTTEEPNTWVGSLLPNMELKIVSVDNDQMAVTAHTLGEVCFKGPQVVITTSAKAESNTYLDHDGWLRTGDLGYLDSMNQLHITGLNNRRNISAHKAQQVLSQSRVSGVRNMSMTPLSKRSARFSDKSLVKGRDFRKMSAGSDSVFME